MKIKNKKDLCLGCEFTYKKNKSNNILIRVEHNIYQVQGFKNNIHFLESFYKFKDAKKYYNSKFQEIKKYNNYNFN